MATTQDYEEFRDHQLWGAIDDLLLQLRSSKGKSDVDQQTLARMLAVLTYFSQFRDISPYLFMSNRVAAAQSLLQYVSHIRSYFDSWDRNDVMTPNTIANIDSGLDSMIAIPHSNSWPALQKAPWAKGVREAADAFRITSEQSLASLRTSVEEANESLRVLREEVTTLSTDAQSRELEAAAATASIRELEQTEAADFEARMSAQFEKLADAAAAQRKEWSDRAQSFLAQLDQDAERGKTLLSYIGDQSVGGGYDKFAAREKNAYRLWMSLGIAAVLATLLYLAYEFNRIGELTPATAILKGTLSLTALGFSTFAFREAGKRSRQAVEAKYRALDLLALRPYTDEMDDTQTAKLRFLLGERLFGPHTETKSTHKPSDDGQLMLSLDDATKLVALLKTAKDVVG